MLDNFKARLTSFPLTGPPCRRYAAARLRLFDKDLLLRDNSEGQRTSRHFITELFISQFLNLVALIL